MCTTRVFFVVLVLLAVAHLLNWTKGQLHIIGDDSRPFGVIQLDEKKNIHITFAFLLWWFKSRLFKPDHGKSKSGAKTALHLRRWEPPTKNIQGLFQRSFLQGNSYFAQLDNPEATSAISVKDKNNCLEAVVGKYLFPLSIGAPEWHFLVHAHILQNGLW